MTMYWKQFGLPVAAVREPGRVHEHEVEDEVLRVLEYDVIRGSQETGAGTRCALDGHGA